MNFYKGCTMEDYRKHLKTAGWIVIVMAVLQIVQEVQKVCNSPANFNIDLLPFVMVVAGIFLLRGGLKSACFVAWFTALSLAVVIGLMLVVPFSLPVSYIQALARNTPPSLWILPAFICALYIPAMFWLYSLLRKPAVKEAMDEAGVKHRTFWKNPVRGFWVGALFLAIIAVSFNTLMKGETHDEVVKRAMEQTGQEYEFFITNINVLSSTNGKSVHAVVAAYNDDELKYVTVEWTE